MCSELNVVAAVCCHGDVWPPSSVAHVRADYIQFLRNPQHVHTCSVHWLFHLNAGFWFVAALWNIMFPKYWFNIQLECRQRQNKEPAGCDEAGLKFNTHQRLISQHRIAGFFYNIPQMMWWAQTRAGFWLVFVSCLRFKVWINLHWSAATLKLQARKWINGPLGNSESCHSCSCYWHVAPHADKLMVDTSKIQVAQAWEWHWVTSLLRCIFHETKSSLSAVCFCQKRSECNKQHPASSRTTLHD